MRIGCPICGERDLREFACRGSAVILARPDEEASDEAWESYLHLRNNPAGLSQELWHHVSGCGAWLVVTRDTVTHEIRACELPEEMQR